MDDGPNMAVIIGTIILVMVVLCVVISKTSTGGRPMALNSPNDGAYFMLPNL
ncbi:MAG: hypothetical protein Q4A82_05160 [Corynebacterium sp.]|nr:hypothetical protein [Corynebacterium sp.]